MNPFNPVRFQRKHNVIDFVQKIKVGSLSDLSQSVSFKLGMILNTFTLYSGILF